MSDLLQTLVSLKDNLLHLAFVLLLLLMAWSLLLAWVAWWLWGVNWAKAWPVLSQGAWVPVVLVVALGALVWSQVLPSPLSLGFTAVPNFWWQLALVGLLAGSALFCGWLQGAMGWTPPEIPVYPEGDAHGHDHGHDDGHGHGHGHGHDNSHGHGHGH